MDNQANWNYPTAISLGAGRISETAEHCDALNIKKPLIVTDPGLADLPFVAELNAQCREAKLGVNLFSSVDTNPTGENITAGCYMFNSGNHDGVIAIGGGSSLDAGKAIALMAGQKHPLWDFEDVGDNWTRVDVDAVVPIIAIPTTAGTGSEVGRASVILDTDAKKKKIIFHPLMMPKHVILDPELTVGLSPELTAATGIDALSHSLEAFCAPGYHPMARGIAVEAIGIVKDWLPSAVADGSDLEARTHMLVASTMGATAFQRGLGAMHALAHSLGALYGSHHGLLNAVLMPYVLVANKSVIEEDISWLSQCIGLEPGFDAFLDWVLELRAELNIPHTLTEIKIPADCTAQIGKMSVIDPSASTNPINFDELAYSEICKNALDGII